MKNKTSTWLWIVILTGLLSLMMISCGNDEEEPTITWQQEFTEEYSGKTANIFQCSDGNFIHLSSGEDIISILFTDEDGNQIAYHEFTGISPNGNINGLYAGTESIVLTYLTGDQNIIRVEFDSNGTILDDAEVSMDDITIEACDSTSDGFIVAGTLSDDNFSVIRYTTSKEVVWQTSSSYSWNFDTLFAVKSLSNGGAVISARRVLGFSYKEYATGYIVKIDDSGDIDWKRDVKALDDLYLGVYYEIPQSVCETADGGILYTGFWGYNKETYLGSHITKISENGLSISRNVFLSYYARNAHETEDNGYIISGFKASSKYRPDSDVEFDGMYIQKLNKYFVVSEWRAVYPSVEPFEGYIVHDIRETADGGYIATCGSWSEEQPFWMVKLN